MSTVKLGKIKLPGDGGSFDSFGISDLHQNSGTIYLANRDLSRIDILDSENDRYLASLDGMDNVSQIVICQDRDMAFSAITGKKEIGVFKPGSEEHFLSIGIDIHPENMAFDWDRDLMMVIGKDDLHDQGRPVISVFQYPGLSKSAVPGLDGVPVFTRYDDLSDLFCVLTRNPCNLYFLSPKDGFRIVEEIHINDENVSSLELCPASNRIIAGTHDGKVISIFRNDLPSEVFWKFREGVSRIRYNSLMNHLYVSFHNSKSLAIIDMETKKTRETIKAGSEIGEILFDPVHNKLYAVLPKISSVEVYLDQGR